MKLRIIGHPNKILRRKCRDIKKLTIRRKGKIQQMFKLMHENNGIGLAAPQVGWNANIFIMNITGKPEDELVFINPIITDQSGGLVEIEEGCLSLPGITGDVFRHLKMTVQATDINGDVFKLEDDSWAARCVQHEMDHLSGILLIDKAERLYKSEDKL